VRNLLHGIGPLALCICFAITTTAQVDDFAAKVERANRAMAAGKFDDAVSLYRTLWRMRPSEIGLRKNLGLALYSAGIYREAAVHFDAVLQQQPSDPPVAFLLGMANVKQGNITGALAPLRKALAGEPGNAMFRYELADALNAAGRPEEAIPHFVKLTQAQPDNSDAWYGLGVAYTLSSRRSFSEIERTAPESGYWYALLGRSRAEQGEFRSAFYLYKQAIAKLPHLSGAHAALAEIYRRTEHGDWAAAEEAKGRSVQPDCGAHPMECEFNSGRLGEILAAATTAGGVEARYWKARASSELAAQAFKRLMTLPPSSAGHRFQAELLRLQNQHAASAKEWREALKLAPGNRAIELELARSLRANQDHQEAARLLAELLQREPGSAELNYLLGSSLLALQESDKAIPYLATAVRLNPKGMQMVADLGRAYLQTGDFSKAIANLEIAAGADREGDLYYLLSQAYRRAGRQEESERALAKRQELVKAGQLRAEERDRNYVISAP